MPGRALNNKMIQDLQNGNRKITLCYHCIKSCKPSEIPYCITEALVNAVKGDIDNGLIFCGSNVDKATKIETVKEVIDDMMYA